ncbi:type II toxin-antitoxin system HicB family antitoxin [Lacticaseibacillus rhamnosus]
MKLKVILLPEAEGGFSVAIPALPGCVSCGDTLEQAMANIREAAEGMLEAMQDRNPFEPLDVSKVIEREIDSGVQIYGFQEQHQTVGAVSIKVVPVQFLGAQEAQPLIEAHGGNVRLLGLQHDFV